VHDGKTSKSPVEQAMQPAVENRWGVWVTGLAALSMWTAMGMEEDTTLRLVESVWASITA
jgi:hypothetical protein